VPGPYRSRDARPRSKDTVPPGKNQILTPQLLYSPIIIATLGFGVWLAIVAPFTESRGIDWRPLDRLIEWHVGAGADGLFPVSLLSKMYDLLDSEPVSVVE